VTGPVSCQRKRGGKNTTNICVSFRSLDILRQILKNIIKGINFFTSLTFKQQNFMALETYKYNYYLGADVWHFTRHYST
jgi:hypothetical protein